jgi:hypothetical protein
MVHPAPEKISPMWEHELAVATAQGNNTRTSTALFVNLDDVWVSDVCRETTGILKMV